MNREEAERFSAELSGTKIDGWELEKPIGSGKTAVVFRARRGDELAALKVYHPELTPDSQTRAELEQRIERQVELSKAPHKHLVAIHGGGRSESTSLYYLVMEFIDAPNLGELVPEFSRDKIRHVIGAVAAAAKHLEENGLAHRDIKPENVCVAPDYGRVVLLDLGVVRPISAEGEVTDQSDVRPFLGTLRYSPPEFLLREETDSMEGWRAVTFYQLGGILHDMIMRRVLFEGHSTPYARLVRAVQDETPKFEGADVESDLLDLARNCLVKDPVLREKLVSWGDFDERPAEEPSTATRLRIRRRIERQAQVQVQASLGADPSGDRRAKQRELEKLTRELDLAICNACASDVECFHPREIRSSSPRSGDDVVTIEVLFPPTSSRTTRTAISVEYRLRLIDFEARAVEVRCAVHYGDHGEWDDAAASGVFLGVFSGESLETALEESLFTALDGAEWIEAPESEN